MQQSLEKLVIPKVSQVAEPQMVALVCTGRAGTKVLQSYLDGHENILMIPGYPLMYLYPHWNSWLEQLGTRASWKEIIDLFCEKHGSVIDSRRVAGLSGLDRLGPDHNEHIEVDESVFRVSLEAMLEDRPIERRSFVLAIHYAYAMGKGWDLASRPVLLFHLHHAPYLKELWDDFPDVTVINAVRNPRSSLHSTRRSLGIVDQSKLNESDRMIYIGRNYRHASKYQYDTLDHLSEYVREERIVAIKHEGLHHDFEGAIKSLLNWMGLESSDCVLQSTFDGKLWWGDVTNTEPVNGLDPNALGERWRASFGKLDSFVIEGVLAEFYDHYSYERTVYSRDSALMRLILKLAILVPSKAERQTMRFYLDPRAHVRFLRAAFAEATGRDLRIDYTWNASYLYKWTYIDLKLWNPRWHQKLLDITERLPAPGSFSWINGLTRTFGKVSYVTGQYSRFWFAALTYPLEIFRRWNMQYRSLLMRTSGKSFLPQAFK